MIKKILSICISALILFITIITIYGLGEYVINFFKLNYDWSVLHAVFTFLILAAFNIVMKY